MRASSATAGDSSNCRPRRSRLRPWSSKARWYPETPSRHPMPRHLDTSAPPPTYHPASAHRGRMADQSRVRRRGSPAGSPGNPRDRSSPHPLRNMASPLRLIAPRDEKNQREDGQEDDHDSDNLGHERASYFPHAGHFARQSVDSHRLIRYNSHFRNLRTFPPP